MLEMRPLESEGRSERMLRHDTCARMAELADAPDSKSGSRKRVGVRPSLWAPSFRDCDRFQDEVIINNQELPLINILCMANDMNRAWRADTTLYSGCHGRKPLDMMWVLAYSSPEFALEYV